MVRGPLPGISLSVCGIRVKLKGMVYVAARISREKVIFSGDIGADLL
jgi:hypothetical protein